MGKYSFDQMEPGDFEALVKALIMASHGSDGSLVVFGSGRDGGREATWSQPANHPRFVPPKTRPDATGRDWVFQVKHHRPTEQSARKAIQALARDLDAELSKIFDKHDVPCDTYVLVTNLSLSGVRHTGARDRLQQIGKAWREKGRVDEVEVWDAVHISAMLDVHETVRTSYLGHILSGDVLRAMWLGIKAEKDRRASILRTYLKHLTTKGANARVDEAGDHRDEALPLEEVFVDLDVYVEQAPQPAAPLRIDEGMPREQLSQGELIEELLDVGDGDRWRSVQVYRDHGWVRELAIHTGTGLEGVREGKGSDPRPRSASSILLQTDCPTLLLAGPGFGKSTLCQFVTIFHAARLLAPEQFRGGFHFWRRLRGVTKEALEPALLPRIPFRIELRRYANWRNDTSHVGLAAYIAQELINVSAEANLTAEDVYALAGTNPVVLVLDGLDEVPSSEMRGRILEDVETFLRRVQTGSDGNVQLILSTRPQGYNDEFERFSPVRCRIADLSEELFMDYRDRWIHCRITQSHDERADAVRRVEAGWAAPDVRALASTLLQATVILVIAREKHDIPRARTALFSKYIDVVFEREIDKQPLVKEYEHELRHVHALAAYEIHRTMENGGADTVGAGRFRQLVLDTWFQLHGREVQARSLERIAQEMTFCARDRLVLLRGDGEDQAHVGFLLTSFREYFAATYFTVHEQADRELVFRNLLGREAHWANVLRFFTGFQQAADQRALVDLVESLEPGEEHPLGLDGLRAGVRMRRTLLMLLPELEQAPRRVMERALKFILTRRYIWTWHDSTAGRVIAGLKNGEFQSLATDLVAGLSASTSADLLGVTYLCHVLAPRRLSEILDRVSRGQPVMRDVVESLAGGPAGRPSVDPSVMLGQTKRRKKWKRTQHADHKSLVKRWHEVLAGRRSSSQARGILSQLLIGPVVQEEFRMWADGTSWQRIEDEGLLEFFDRRVSLSPQHDLVHKDLENALWSMVQGALGRTPSRPALPPTTVQAALVALLALESSPTRPIDETDWTKRPDAKRPTRC